MKEVQVSLWEMTKEEAAALPDGTQYLIYNPVLSYYNVVTSGKDDVAKRKNAAFNLKYLSFDEPKASK